MDGLGVGDLEGAAAGALHKKIANHSTVMRASCIKAGPHVKQVSKEVSQLPALYVDRKFPLRIKRQAVVKPQATYPQDHLSHLVYHPKP